MEVKDTGNRTEFGNGALRDINEENGRMDLLPLKIVGDIFMRYDECFSLKSALGVTPPLYYTTFNKDQIAPKVLGQIEDFLWEGNKNSLMNAFIWFALYRYKNLETAFLELSKHYKNCLVKYPENNWRRKLPLKSFLDSAPRHFMKWSRGDDDEPHDKAFLWNIISALWTFDHFTYESDPDIINIPYYTFNETKKEEEVPDGETK